MPAPSTTTRWRAVTGLLLGGVIVAVIAAAVWVLAQPQPLEIFEPAPEPTASAETPRSTSTPIPEPTTTGTLAVLGDSFVRGLGGPTDYVTVLGEELGVTTVKFGETGTGFVNYGLGLPYDQRLESVLYTQPAGLVVQGSANDYLTSTESVVDAARVLIEHARDIDESLPIAIVGPIFFQYEAQPAILDQRFELEKLAEELEVTYVDPQGWITDETKPLYISGDNLHPTTAGYEHIGIEMAKQLRQFAADLP